MIEAIPHWWRHSFLHKPAPRLHIRNPSSKLTAPAAVNAVNSPRDNPAVASNFTSPNAAKHRQTRHKDSGGCALSVW